MTSVAEHYDGLLAEHYSWMFGVPPIAKAGEQRELLERLHIVAGELGVDLGAGSGFQSMALADLGFKRVLAIDTSNRLLKELRSNCGSRPVTAIEDDMLHILQHVAPGTADVVVCMGDTLTHLPQRESVPQLFAAVSTALSSNGRFVVTYRDLSTELQGVDRFIPVRSTAEKIMTCFLEYHPGLVMVHDLIHTRSGETQSTAWQLAKSCYPKLRLAVDDICRELSQAGLRVEARENIRGLSVLGAQKV
ncbi:MAG TPA: class I SAM-dependent methyltransferase [Steroidobacteraceae bacterium]